MSVILEYEISQATEKLPSLHDRRYRLEVYSMHTLTIWASRIYPGYPKRLFESEDKCEAIDTKKNIYIYILILLQMKVIITLKCGT